MNTKKNIDSLFEKEKNTTETPIFSENEIASILGEKGAFPNKLISRIKLLQGVFTMLALTSIGTVVLIAMKLIGTTHSEDENGKSVANKDSSKRTVIIHFKDKPEKKGNVIINQNAEFKGIHLVELSNEELASIGVFNETRGVAYYNKSKESMKISSIGIGRNDSATATKFIISMDGLIVYPGREDIVEKSLIRFNPRMVTDDQGMKRLTRFDEEEMSPSLSKKLRQEIKKLEKDNNYDGRKMEEYGAEMEKLVDEKYTTSNLIPILIRTGKTYTTADKKNLRWRPDCIFWYDATPEFIAALPDRFKNQIVIEQKAVETLALKTETAIENVKPLPSPQQVLKEMQKKENMIEPQEILIPEQEKRETGNTYFDVWRGASGAIISSSLSPNPVRNQYATVKFALKESRNVIITLHDIYGRRIAELCKSTGFKSGEYSQEILLKDVQPGIYLIAIQTDKGEQAVQRVIVE